MKKIGFVITAGHLDIEWYQPLRSYRFWTIETFEDLKKACETRDDFVTYVLDGQVFPLEEYLEVVPEDADTIKRLIHEGRLSIGPFYTQFDEWLPSAESMIRNCLYGNRRARKYGRCMNAGYLPDNFGHPMQLPQILQNFGIDSLLFMRGLPEIPGGHPDEFLYKGLDGSSVLVSHFRESYSGAFDIFDKDIPPIQPREVPYYRDYLSFDWHRELARHDDPEKTARNMIANVHRIQERYPSGIIPLIAGFDHMPPQINIGDSVKAANDMQDDIHFLMGNAEDYIRLVYERMTNPQTYDMELLGSRYQHVLLGALSTRSYLKTQNFACEALMERYVEPLAAMASLQGYKIHQTLLDEAWQFLMMSSAHDSIHGSSVDEVHTEMEARFAGVRQIASGLIHDTLSYLGKGQPNKLLVFAPSCSGTLQAAEVWLPVGDRNITICREDGTPLPTQILERTPPELNGMGQPRNELFPAPVYRKVIFQDKMAANALAVYKFTEDVLAGDCGMLQIGEDWMENEFLRVEIQGGLLNLYHKEQKRWYRGLNLLVEEADAGDAWDFSPPWVPGEVNLSSSVPFTSRIAEKGALRISLEVNGCMKVPSGLTGDMRRDDKVDMPVTFRITLYRNVCRADVRVTIQNTARDHRIRLHSAPGIRSDFIRSQGHLAILDRLVNRPETIEEWYQPATQLYPFREWLAVDDETAGLAIAVKGLYDYEAKMNPLTRQPEVSITLLRGIQLMGRLNTMQRKGEASWALDTPGAQCLGEQVFEWSYVPYSSETDEKAPFLGEVQNFLYPPVTHAVRTMETIPENLPTQPLFSWNESNLQFSAFKNAYDGDGYILRLFENQGKDVETDIDISDFKEVWYSNMNEDMLEPLAISAGKVRVHIGAYKTVTLKMKK